MNDERQEPHAQIRPHPGVRTHPRRYLGAQQFDSTTVQRIGHVNLYVQYSKLGMLFRLSVCLLLIASSCATKKRCLGKWNVPCKSSQTRFKKSRTVYSVCPVMDSDKENSL